MAVCPGGVRCSGCGGVDSRARCRRVDYL